jgi:hypothetical protein
MSTQAASGRQSGWVTFSAVVLFAVGFLRIITAISYFANSHRINDLTGHAFSGHLWAYGIWDLCIAGLALLAGFSLMEGGGFGRAVAYIWGILVIVQSFLLMASEPWYGFGMLVLASLVVFGLASSSESEQI